MEKFLQLVGTGLSDVCLLAHVDPEDSSKLVYEYESCTSPAAQAEWICVKMEEEEIWNCDKEGAKRKKRRRRRRRKRRISDNISMDGTHNLRDAPTIAFKGSMQKDLGQIV